MNDLYVYNARLVRVVDGDTIIADVDLGFDTWKRTNIRFYGIDAYESRTRDLEEKELGIKAKELLINLFLNSNGNFVLKSMGLDKYGRSLGIVLIPNEEAEGMSIDANQYLVNEGLAVPYFGGKR
jgi:micrococcal nuclease